MQSAYWNKPGGGGNTTPMKKPYNIISLTFVSSSFQVFSPCALQQPKLKCASASSAKSFTLYSVNYNMSVPLPSFNSILLCLFELS